MEVVFEWSPDPSVLSDDLFTLAAALGDLDVPLHRSVEEVMTRSIATNFEVGGRPSWVPLELETLENCKRRGIGGGPLVRSGKLAAVASNPSIWDYTADSAFVPDLPGAEYGGIHMEGAPVSGHGAHIPARPFMMFQEEDEDAIQEIFAEFIDSCTAEFWSAS